MSLYQKFVQEFPEAAKQQRHVLRTPNRRPTASLARQQAQANIEKVMSQIRNGSAILRQQTIQQQQRESGRSPSLLAAARLPARTSGAHYKRLLEQTTSSKYQPTSPKCARAALNPLEAIMRQAGSDDPALLRWLRDIRFEPELEPLALQARTCAHDPEAAQALGIRYSQVAIQEIRQESSEILDFVDQLIGALPIPNAASLSKFYVDFSDLYAKIMRHTSERTSQSQQTIHAHQGAQNPLTISYATPRKSAAATRALRPLDKLTVQIRNLCLACANQLCEHQDQATRIDSGLLESQLRKLKELFGKFVEISIRAECRNIVQGLQFDFSQMSLNRLSSNSSLRPIRPFESSRSQLPLKWALIALWQLTREDSYICRALTERSSSTSGGLSFSFDERVCEPLCSPLQRGSPSKQRLDYSTKYEPPAQMIACSSEENEYGSSSGAGSLRHSDYQRLCDLTNRKHNLTSTPAAASGSQGALKSALRSKELAARETSTIELLIEIIISQPNKHERLDMLNYIHTSAYSNQQQQLIKLEEWDQSVSAAIYTSNQYKVAALRILNQLCVCEQAVKTILKCFSTPPPGAGQSQPENKIIRSIFECYQTNQEHIYQNEPMFETVLANKRAAQQERCSQRHPVDEYSDYSDYGSRQGPVSSSTELADELAKPEECESADEERQQELEGEDAVVREALRLLVQLTASFHRTNQGLDFYTLVGRFSIESMVKYLTNIVKGTANREMLLLALSALANISFITTEPMKAFATNRTILDMFRWSKLRSRDLELRDQAVTVLANAADKNLLDIISNGGLTFLLSCLESCPTRMANFRQQQQQQQPTDDQSNSENEQPAGIESRPRRDRKPIDLGQTFVDELDCLCEHSSATSGRLCANRLAASELAAMERIHQKAAVAFARMAADASTIKLLVELGGVKRLIELCKFSQKRNFSETVLIACIAALRKMARHIDRDTFKHFNALDLIELEFDRTLEIYGNRHHGDHLIYASEV